MLPTGQWRTLKGHLYLLLGFLQAIGRNEQCAYTTKKQPKKKICIQVSGGCFTLPRRPATTPVNCLCNPLFCLEVSHRVTFQLISNHRLPRIKATCRCHSGTTEKLLFPPLNTCNSVYFYMGGTGGSTRGPDRG